MSSITTRILTFFDSTKLGDRELARKIGLSHGVISAMRNKGTNISVEKLEKIFNAFPHLSPGWIAMGRGRMMHESHYYNDPDEKQMVNERGKEYVPKNTDIKIVERVVPVSINIENNDLIPIVDIRAAANYLEGYQSTGYIQELDHISIPHHIFKKQGLYRGFTVAGDSMHPTFLDGEHVIARRMEVSEYDDIMDLKVYVIVLEGENNNGIYIKRLKNRLGDHGFIRCRSDNKAHLSFNAQAEEIVEIWEAAAGLRIGNFPNVSETLYNKIDDLQDKYESIQIELAKIRSHIK